MPERSRNDERTLRRTQFTIAAVRLTFSVVAAGVIGLVLLNGDHNEDRYEVPGTDWEVRLWQLLALGLAILAIVLIGAIGDLTRARRRRRIL